MRPHLRLTTLLSAAFGAACLLASPVLAPGRARHVDPTTSVGLADATVIVIRHAEKPLLGRGLTSDGMERARRYVDYFRHFSDDAESLVPDALYASSDSPESERPRLTLSPLAQALGLPIAQPFSDGQTKALANTLRSQKRGNHVLICWHHGEIPRLLRDLGADPATLLHGERWPPDIYDRAVVLHYDHAGRLARAQVVDERLMPGDR